jgi:energy-coupling factor transport system substrate-specific component
VVRIESPGIIVVPVCIGINFTGRLLATQLHLPLLGDAMGTVLGAVLAGPWIGGSIGLMTNLISSNSIDPNAAPYAAVSFVMGFAVGTAARQGWHKRPVGWLVLWAICFLISSLFSTPLNLLLTDGNSGVPLGDAIFSRLSGRLPLPLASYLGEAAIDAPDKLIAVVGALLIYRALPRPAAPTRALQLDLAAAFTFVFRSQRRVARMALASLCLLFSWLVLPLLLLVGYAVSVARNGSLNTPHLPAWDNLTRKLKDGALMTIIFFAWNVPPAAITFFPQPLVIAGDLLGLLVAVLEPAIWSQYMHGGFWAAFDVRAILRRVRFNVGLTLVVGALGIALPVLGLLGLVGLVVGVLPALVYASLVSAYLFGQYATITDAALMPSRERAHGQAIL